MRHPAALKNVTFDGTLNVNATQYLDIGGISKIMPERSRIVSVVLISMSMAQKCVSEVLFLRM